MHTVHKDWGQKKYPHQEFSLLPTKSSMEACRGQSGQRHVTDIPRSLLHLLKTQTCPGRRSVHSPAWAASPSSAFCSRQERPGQPGPREGQSPWPEDPPGCEPETERRTPGRSQTHVPERFPHSPASSPNKTTGIPASSSGSCLPLLPSATKKAQKYEEVMA